MKRRIFTIVLICIVLIMTSCATTLTYAEKDDYFEKSTPEEQGLKQEYIDQAIEYINSNKIDICSFLILKNGYLVTEYYGYYDNNMNKRDLQTYKNFNGIVFPVHSSTKAFVSTIIGIAIDDGLLNLTDKVLDFFPEEDIQNIDERKQAMTIKDLLTLEDGLEFDFFGNDTTLEMQESENPIVFQLSPPMVSEPGTQWSYNSGSVHLLLIILDKILKEQKKPATVLAYTHEKLFNPLEISNYKWDRLKHFDDIPLGGGGLQLQPQDMLKLGSLYAQRGMWNGQRLLSESWIEEATDIHAKAYWDTETDFGYLWYTSSELDSFFYSLGAFGQDIYVSSKYDMVIVFTGFQPGETAYHENRDIVKNYLKPAIVKD